MREKLHDVGLGNDFMTITTKVQETKTKIDKWYYVKLKASEQQRKQKSKKVTCGIGKSICTPYI